MRKTATASAVTSLPQAPRDEADARVKRYLITIGIRIVCFALMVLVTPYGWYTWVFAFGAAILPYIAVVFANESAPTPTAVAEAPAMVLDAMPPVPSEPVADHSIRTITVHEIHRPTSDG